VIAVCGGLFYFAPKVSTRVKMISRSGPAFLSSSLDITSMVSLKQKDAPEKDLFF
jgi:hypothetical protein